MSKPDPRSTIELLGNAKSELIRALSRAEVRSADLRKIEKIAAQIEALQAKLKNA